MHMIAAATIGRAGKETSAMADDLLDNSPDDDDTSDGIDLEGGGKPNTGRQVVDDDDDDDEPADDDTDQDKAAGDKKPAAPGKTYTQDDIDRIKAATVKERETVKKLRGELRELKKAQTPPADTTDAVAKAREEAAAAEIARLKPIAIRAKAEALLTQHKLQNATETRVSNLVRQLDLDEIDIDPDTGKIVGLEEQIEALVDEYPELFTPPPAAPVEEPAKQKPRIPRGDGSDRKNPPPGPDKNKDTAAYLAQKILNR